MEVESHRDSRELHRHARAPLLAPLDGKSAGNRLRPFTHPDQAETAPRRGRDHGRRVDADPVVFDDEVKLAVALEEHDGAGRGFTVTGDVGEGLLHDAVHADLDLRLQPLVHSRMAQLRPDARARGEALQVQVQGLG